ncbi:MAG: class I SAM-dependent methyltransferase [Verrucomicrobia bacterium]|nr:class I SAM-dependent methyltransferase [Verrucomicrobiota bacterium]
MKSNFHWLLFEDEHLFVANKPAGLNTHSPSPYAGEGLYEWLRHREPRWADLAILHRLDKETSGVIVFGKTAVANRSLTEQFTQRAVRKKYLLLTDRAVSRASLVVKSALVRAGEKYLSRPPHAGGEMAETRFRVLESSAGRTLVEAEPATGRTHQIRVHAAAHGFPILGDTLYGGTAGPRVCLHAAQLTFKHPVTDVAMSFEAPVDFSADPRFALRSSLIDGESTNAFRLIHGAADGWPGWHVDRLGDFLLSEGERTPGEPELKLLSIWLKKFSLAGVYHKTWNRRVREARVDSASPQLLLGNAAPDAFRISENGVNFELSFREGYSTGLFLDQRDNRRRFLVNHVAAEFPLFLDATQSRQVLNTFAYTCGFSVCAAKAGARVTSLDLSRKYLEWGKRNFAANNLDPNAHDFIFGDVFDWLRRFARQRRQFDAVVLDPPTFSTSKAHGAFRVEKDYAELAELALAVLRPGGVLFASANSAKLVPQKFIDDLSTAVTQAGRRIVQSHYVPQPPDFPVHRDEPAYLKTIWLRIG